MQMRTLNKIKNQENGLASIVVVGLLVVLLTLITLGFAKIMGRSVQNQTSSETAASASYAAQSGLNDLATYLRTNLNVKATKCNDLIVDSSGNPRPFYNDINISGNNNTRLTCLLINQEPMDLAYQNITNLKSKVVKLTTNAVTGSIDSFMFSWESRDSSKTGLPATNVGLLDESTWNGGSNNYVPMLRVSLYPITTSGALDDTVQTSSKTFYLVPANAGGAASKTFDYNATANGSRQHIMCDKTQIPNFTGTSDALCNVVITGLENVPNIDYFYARITPIYSNVNLYIKANDIDQRAVKFKGVQAVLDVTAKSGPAAKRLQSRVDISGIDSVTGNVIPSSNLTPSENVAPDFTLRSANAICKRYKITNDVYDYLTLDGSCPNGICSGVGCGPQTPPPTLSMNINGEDSQNARYGYTGTVYISNGGSGQVNWTSQDATSCVASSTQGAWSGEQKGIMTFNANGTGTGSKTFPGITSVTDYSLTCTGPGTGISPGVKKTVRAWPRPVASISGPANITAGTNYTISWNANNASNCTFAGNWNSTASVANPTGVPNSDSQTMSLGYQDDSTKTFTVTCFDPEGNSTGPKTITYSRAAGTILPPAWDCYATTSASDTGDASVNYSWSGACPNANPALGTYSVTSSTDGGFNSTSRTGSGTTPGLRTSQFCLTLNSSLSPWGVVKTSTSCATPQAPGSGGSSPCVADVTPYDNGNGTGGFRWSGSCPPANPGRGYYHFYNCVNIDCNAIGSSGWVGPSGPDITVGPGYYCVEYQSGADPWGWLRDSGQQCVTISMPPVTGSFSVGDLVWWQNDYSGMCSIPDGGGHTWFICNIGVSASQAGTPSSQIHCQLLSDGSGVGTFGASVGGRQLGWYGAKTYQPSHTVGWHCYSDRGGSSYDPSITRDPNYP